MPFPSLPSIRIHKIQSCQTVYGSLYGGHQSWLTTSTAQDTQNVTELYCKAVELHSFHRSCDLPWRISRNTTPKNHIGPYIVQHGHTQVAHSFSSFLAIANPEVVDVPF
jgi:hypothetical protein